MPGSHVPLGRVYFLVFFRLKNHGGAKYGMSSMSSIQLEAARCVGVISETRIAERGYSALDKLLVLGGGEKVDAHLNSSCREGNVEVLKRLRVDDAHDSYHLLSPYAPHLVLTLSRACDTSAQLL